MSLSKKILLLLLLLIVFMAVCVYTKIGQFTNELSPITAKEETTLEITQVVHKEETLPLTQEEELKKVDETTPINEEENTLETQKNIEKITEQNFEEEKKQNINASLKENLQEQINKILENNSIMFQRMSYEVTNSSNKVIERIAKIIIENQDIKIEVAGHTDAKGDDSFNQMISEQRANSVKKLLVGFGVDESRLSAKGYGETMPLVPNDKDGYSLTNRRVEFNIIEE